jgi:ABC-type uncharacterized transport system permease subunit
MNKVAKNINYSRGFISTIFIIIVVLIVASFFGFGPQTILNDFILPIFSFIWGIIVWIVNFVVAIIKAAINAFNSITNIFN